MTNAKLIYTNVFNSDGSVSETTMDILYSQLEPAKPERGIRADGLPKREHYEVWVRSRPYKHWFIITEDQGGAEEIIGQVYLTKAITLGSVFSIGNAVSISVIGWCSGWSSITEKVRFLLSLTPTMKL
jgi:hypothetical protein